MHWKGLGVLLPPAGWTQTCRPMCPKSYIAKKQGILHCQRVEGDCAFSGCRQLGGCIPHSLGTGSRSWGIAVVSSCAQQPVIRAAVGRLLPLYRKGK